MRRLVLLVCLFSLPALTAYAGPANRFAAKLPIAARVPVNLDGFGAPLPAVARNPSDLNLFATGQLNFKEVESLPEVGPIMNGLSCAGCHSQPAIGGGGLFINELRVRNNTAPGPLHLFAVDNFLRNGPQMQGTTPIFAQGMRAEPVGCQITSPNCQPSACQREEMARTTFNYELQTCDPTGASFAAGDNCVVGRAAVPLFGDGLVEAVADKDLEALAASEPAPVRGIAKQVTELGAARVGRFGWKNDHATLRAFSSDAYLNENGITNPDAPAPLSTCAMTESQYNIPLQTADDPEDTSDYDGRADIDRFTDFMRALAPPPTLPRNASARSGAQLFASLGCADCHTANMRTSRDPASFVPPSTGGVPISRTLKVALTNRLFHPYSDFLLHDMGALGDGMTSGTAGPTMMRTAPLWGLRGRSEFLHDGRARDYTTAIKLHDGQGAAAAQAFGALTATQQQDLSSFLNTL
jgi:hypothetical protein